MSRATEDRASPILTFAIPLRRPVSVKDREELDRVLSLTLGSLYNQSDGAFRILIASAYSPRLPAFVDDRLEIVSFPGIVPKTHDEGTHDSGTRMQAMAHRFAHLGGGYLMFVDHDDFVSR
ncbi:MAG: hypothetical protein JOZ55_11690, partial [Alphaproteobacteria bacterium]|nr:hypothetical protein [Alphaproteobacteria bacterium]